MWAKNRRVGENNLRLSQTHLQTSSAPLQQWRDSNTSQLEPLTAFVSEKCAYLVGNLKWIPVTRLMTEMLNPYPPVKIPMQNRFKSVSIYVNLLILEVQPSDTWRRTRSPS